MNRSYWLWTVVGFGFLLRCLWWWQHPVINSPDAIVYLREADNLFTKGMESDVYMPLYPALLHLFGGNGIIALQILLSTASIYLAYRIAHHLWSTGLVAAILMAVHPMLIYYATFRLTETVFIFLLLLGLLSLYRDQIIVAAIAFTLADLTRPALDLVFPLIIIAASKPSLRQIARRLSIFLVVYCTLMSAWWVHNYQKYHQFVRLDLGGGIVMFLENNEVFERVGFDWEKLSQSWAPFNTLDPVERDAALKSAAISYIKDNPIKWLRGTTDRFVRFFTPDDLNFSIWQKRISLFVMVIALAGALMSLAFVSRSVVPLWIPIVFLTVFHLSFLASPRYRLPLDPLLIILASGYPAQIRVRPPISPTTNS
jgi:4-amino-4-deoxy-L-arabinose transferase-like glycosyltransferase